MELNVWESSTWLSTFLFWLHSLRLHELEQFMFRKKNKSIVFFNNRDIVSFIESRCGKGAAIEN